MDRVCEIVSQLALPLARGHELGIVHGGVTLDNMLLDNDGRPMITDFGMGAGSKPSDDIEGLATCAAQLIVGSDGSLTELAGRIDTDLADVLAKPRAHGTIEQFAEAFRSAVGPNQGQVPVVDLPNPYKGLVPFDEADTGQFYGRERLVERMLARLGGPDPLTDSWPSSGRAEVANRASSAPVWSLHSEQAVSRAPTRGSSRP